MNAIWKETVGIRAYDVDFNNRIKVSSIFNHMQDVASIHADALELGFKQLSDVELFWVLAWAKIEIEAYPTFGNALTIKTWPRCPHKLYSMRDFIISDQANQTLCKATTAWLLINAKTKRPTDVTHLPTEIPYQPNEQALADVPENISVEQNCETIYTKHIQYTDIDINQHVNNAKYIEYILDCYEEEFHRAHQLKTITISFVSESKYGDEIALRLSRVPSIGDAQYVEAINSRTQKPAFQALVTWKPSLRV